MRAQRVFKTEPQYPPSSGDESDPSFMQTLIAFFTKWWSPATSQPEQLGYASVYDEQGTLLAEVGSGGANSVGQAQYIYLPTADGPVPVATVINGSVYAVHADHLNTPRRLTDASGQPVWQWSYSAFGEDKPTLAKNRFADPDTTPNAGTANAPDVKFNLRYPGQYADQESGLFYNGFRTYVPAIGRYTQADPIGLEGGWNRFLYVRGNPLNAIDPLGLWDWSFGAGFHFWAMPAPGAGGMNFSSTWKPGGGLPDASSDQAAEMVWGGFADVGVNAGITNLSSCPTGVPTSLNIGIGRYGGVQIGFKNGQFDGINVGLGLGISSPVTYTTPVSPKKR